MPNHLLTSRNKPDAADNINAFDRAEYPYHQPIFHLDVVPRSSVEYVCPGAGRRSLSVHLVSARLPLIVGGCVGRARSLTASTSGQGGGGGQRSTAPPLNDNLWPESRS